MAERRSPQLDWQIFSITSLAGKFEGAAFAAISDKTFFNRVGANELKLYFRMLDKKIIELKNI